MGIYVQVGLKTFLLNFVARSHLVYAELLYQKHKCTSQSV